METARISIALAIHSLDPTGNAGRDLEIAGISIALIIHSFDPTKDAISDSAQYISSGSYQKKALKDFEKPSFEEKTRFHPHILNVSVSSTGV